MKFDNGFKIVEEICIDFFFGEYFGGVDNIVSIIKFKGFILDSGVFIDKMLK
jgi:hypothetical protein